MEEERGRLGDEGIRSKHPKTYQEWRRREGTERTAVLEEWSI